MTRPLAAALLALLLILLPASADDAQDAFDEIARWMQEEGPKATSKTKLRSFRKAVIKRLEAFIKEHPDYRDRVGAERLLGETYLALPDTRSAMELFEEMAEAEGDRGIMGRVGVLKTLCQKRQLSAARKRLDGYLEAHSDEPSLLEFDKFLRRYEKGDESKTDFKRMKRGDEFPGFRGTILGSGETFDLSKSKGKKATLIGFWVPFNGDEVNKIGQKELEAASRLFKAYEGEGLTIIGVPYYTDAERLRKWLDEVGIVWPQLVEGAEVLRDIGASPLPQWVLLGPDGRLIKKDLRGDELIDVVGAVME